MIGKYVPQTRCRTPGIVDGVDLPGYACLFGELTPDVFEKGFSFPVINGGKELFLGPLRIGKPITGAFGKMVGIAVKLLYDPVDRIFGKSGSPSRGAGLISYNQFAISDKDRHLIQNLIKGLGSSFCNGLTFRLFHRFGKENGSFRTNFRDLLEKPFP